MTSGAQDKNPYEQIANYVDFDEEGRIWEAGSQGRGYTLDKIAAGERRTWGGSGDWRRDTANLYVDRAAGNVVKPRPNLDVSSEKLTLAPLQTVTLPNVPAATITYSGTLSGSLKHAGGALPLGFKLVGTYRLVIEAFPYKPKTIDVEVRL